VNGGLEGGGTGDLEKYLYKTVFVERRLWEYAGQLSERTGDTMSTILETAIRKYISSDKRVVPRDMITTAPAEPGLPSSRAITISRNMYNMLEDLGRTTSTNAPFLAHEALKFYMKKKGYVYLYV
jgi:hypothetical protein